jgi:hypothetical protein
VQTTAAGGGIRVIAADGHEASCGAGEVLISAFCTGAPEGYPLNIYPGGAKCGWSGDNAKVTISCAPAAQVSTAATSEGASSGALRIVASDTNEAWCADDETMISAFCTGAPQGYPLNTYPGGAKCGWSGDGAKATAVCMKK